jgi:hypothetical protein
MAIQTRIGFRMGRHGNFYIFIQTHIDTWTCSYM